MREGVRRSNQVVSGCGTESAEWIAGRRGDLLARRDRDERSRVSGRGEVRSVGAESCRGLVWMAGVREKSTSDGEGLSARGRRAVELRAGLMRERLRRLEASRKSEGGGGLSSK